MRWLVNESSEKWFYRVLLVEMAMILFLIPAGRFHASVLGYPFTFGGNVYNNFPILVITWILWKLSKKDKNIQLTIMHFPFLILFFISLLSSLGSPDPYQAFGETLELLLYILFFMILIDFNWKKEALFICVTSFILGNLWMGMIACKQVITNVMDTGITGINATFAYPNTLGIYCLLALTILSCIYEKYVMTRYRQFIYGGIIVVFLCSLLTVTRATYLGLIVWLFVFIITNKKYTNKYKLIIVLIVLISVFANPIVINKFLNTLNELEGGDQYSRMLIWPFVMDFSIENMSYFGYGKGPVLRDIMDSTLIADYKSYYLTRYWKPHNIYLYIYVSMGIPGLFAFCYVIIAYLYQLYLSQDNYRYFLLAGLLAYLVHQCFELNFLDGNVPAALFLMFSLRDILTTCEINSGYSLENV